MTVLEDRQLRALGKTGVKVSALGVGTNKWSQGANDEAVFETYQTFLDGGMNFIDTAEVYGFGKSERLIGDCIRRDRRPVTVASKFVPFIARTSPRHLLRALDASLARLGLEALDLYYIHFPFPFTNLDALADAMVKAVSAGKIRSVGVSNFSADQMRRIADRLARSNVPLAANEVNYSLLNRKAESNGVLDACRELDVALVAYFPLASGRLTASPTSGKTGRAETLQKTLQIIAEAHQASISQVALNWLLVVGHLRIRTPTVWRNQPPHPVIIGAYRKFLLATPGRLPCHLAPLRTVWPFESPTSAGVTSSAVLSASAAA